MNIQTILHLIETNEQFAHTLGARNSKIEADIISFRLNPNCSCKSKIIKYLEDNKEEQEFVLQWIQNSQKASMQQPQVDTQKLESINKMMNERARMVLKPTLPQPEWSKYKDVVGEVVEIDPNPDKYKEMMTIAREKWFYNGLNVTETLKTDPTTGNEKVVWLVFFY